MRRRAPPSGGMQATLFRETFEGTSWPYPRVLRNGSAWRYEGRIHERPVKNGLPHPAHGATVPTAYIRHEASDAVARLGAVYDRDVPILEEELSANPKDVRALHYLATSYMDLAGHVDAETAITFRMLAMSYFHRRALLDGPAEEVQYARRGFLTAAVHAANTQGSGIFALTELLGRLNGFCQEFPDDAEAHVLRLHVLGATTTRAKAPELIAAALHSAEVAVRARGRVSPFPVSGDCEWQSYVIAAMNAHHLSLSNPEARDADHALWSVKLGQYAQKARDAGAPEHILMALRKAREAGISVAEAAGRPPQPTV